MQTGRQTYTEIESIQKNKHSDRESYGQTHMKTDRAPDR